MTCSTLNSDVVLRMLQENTKLQDKYNELLTLATDRAAIIYRFVEKYGSIPGEEFSNQIEKEIVGKRNRLQGEVESLERKKAELEEEIYNLQNLMNESFTVSSDSGEEYETDSEGISEDSDEESDEESDEDDESLDSEYEEVLREKEKLEKTVELLKITMASHTKIIEKSQKELIEERVQLEAENRQLRENNNYLEEQLEIRTSYLFDYIVRFPKFGEQWSIREALAENNKFKIEISNLQDELLEAKKLSEALTTELIHLSAENMKLSNEKVIKIGEMNGALKSVSKYSYEELKSFTESEDSCETEKDDESQDDSDSQEEDEDALEEEEAGSGWRRAHRANQNKETVALIMIFVLTFHLVVTVLKLLGL